MEPVENAEQEPEMDQPEPEDKYNLIYWACVLCGAAFLMPWNTVVISVDYFLTTYPGTNIVFAISVSFLVMAWLTCTLSTLTVEFLNPTTKIYVGFALSILCISYFTIFEIWVRPFPTEVAYHIVLVIVIILSISAATIQVNLYGFVAVLPQIYTQGLMVGESVAGVITVILRVITKASITNLTTSTILFFALCLLFITVCLLVFVLARRVQYVAYHVRKCREWKKVGSEEETELTECDKLGIEAKNATAYGSTASEVVVQNGIHSEENTSTVRRPLTIRLIHAVDVRIEVIRTIWPYMLAMFLDFAVTLSVFPGLSSEVVSCSLGTWMPVIMLSVFNVFDLFGKIIVRWEYDWPKPALVLCTAARVILVPLFILCSKPRSEPIISGEALPIIFSIVNGVTNGYFGSVPIVIGPTKVSPDKREMAGNLMVFALTTGLAVGSASAYGYLAILGPRTPENNPCAFYNVTTPTP